MKRSIKKAFFYFTSIYTVLKYHKCLFAIKSVLYDLKLSIACGNRLYCKQASLIKSKIIIEGQNNQINFEGEVSNVNVLIVGKNNQIVMQQGSKIIHSEIILRGNNCKIEIGQGSTFGKHLYMVCMGQDNYIKIGHSCMFADNIDIWNTDSHPIKNKDGILLNPSRPINIGNKVWVGKNTVILKNVHIGDGAIIGINSTVTKDCPTETVCVGMPVKPIQDTITWERTFITE